MRLAITQRSSLRRLCSAAKERMLGEAAPDRVPITVLGAGRSLIGDSITVDLTRDEVEAALDEFLPLTRADEESRGRDRRAGLRELGLPYETDPAITRHLAAFLARSAAVFAPDHRAVVVDGRTADDPSRSGALQRRLLHPAGRARAGRAGAGRLVRGPTAVARDREPRGGGRHRRGDLRPAAGRHRPHRGPREGGERTRVLHRSRRAARSGSDRGGLRARARDGGRDGTDLRSSVHRRDESSRLLLALQLDDAPGSRRRYRLSRSRTWTRGNMRRSSPSSASGGSRVTSSCRSACRSRSRKSARWKYGADRRRPNTAGGCSFRCGARRRRWTERRTRRRRMSRAKS